MLGLDLTLQQVAVWAIVGGIVAVGLFDHFLAWATSGRSRGAPSPGAVTPAEGDEP